MSPDLHPDNQRYDPESVGELSRFLAENAAGQRLALNPLGGGTTLNYGYPPAAGGVAVSSSQLNQVVEYPVRDMTITVEAGISIDELAKLLAKNRQQLPLDVPLSHRATAGGVAATNRSGPRRFGYGTMRDYLIGVAAVDAGGRLFHGGGRVVKNVAGYDICKMLVGSLGTLGFITQLTFKLKPLAETSALLWVSCTLFAEIDDILSRLTTSATRPVVLEVLNPHAARQITAATGVDLAAQFPTLVIGVEGAERECRWQIETLRNELAVLNPEHVETVAEEKTSDLLAALTEYGTKAETPLTFRANLLPSQTINLIEQGTAVGVAIQAHAGNGIVIGHLPKDAATLDGASGILTPLRDFTRQHRGNLVILNCDDEWKQHLPLFGEAEPSWAPMQRLKSALDPHNLLNRGRFLDSC
jgi:glycolate oxidase FAD binding subunit